MNRTHLLAAAGLLLALSVSLLSIGDRSERGQAAPLTVQSIVAPGPIEQINIGNELSCQFGQSGVPHFAAYPATIPLGDCGTILAVGATLYAPDFSGHAGTSTVPLGLYTAFTPVSQSAPTGTGSAADPYRIVTVVDAGTTGLRLTQTDSYVAGSTTFSTSVQVQNSGASTRAVRLYRVLNCYLNGTNWGYGAVDAIAKSVACATSPSAVDAGPVLSWAGITAADHYQQGAAPNVWAAINTGGELADTCECAAFTEHAVALSWSRTIAAGASASVGQTGGIVEVQPLTVTKTADAPSTTTGGANGYTITLSNPNAFGVTIETVEDSLPSGFTYTTGSTNGLTTFDPDVVGQTLTWWETISVPGSGSLSLHFGVTVSSTPGNYTNSATTSSPAVVVIGATDTAPVQVVALGTATPGPTATPTSTPVPPTATPTSTPVPPSATPTGTPVPPTATSTNTPVPPTSTPTSTPIPPTATPTSTPVPPTATRTATSVPPTATRTSTPVPARTPTAACPDFDGDGVVGFSDLRAIIRHLGAKRFDATYDLDRDGRVTGRDVVLVMRQFGRRC